MTIWTDDEAGGTVWSEDEAAGTALAADTGASLVGFIQSGSGLSATDVQTQLRKSEYFATVADMQAFNPGADCTAFVSGEDSEWDGRGGVYRFNSSDTRTDDGSTIIAPTSGTGRWVRVLSPNTNMPAPTMVLLGDSITAQGDTVASSKYNNHGWQNWMRNALKDRLSFLANKAVSGRTAADVLSNFDTDLAGYAPGWISLFIGHNDFVTRTAAAIIADVTSIYYKTRTLGARLLLVTPYPNTTMTNESYRTALLGAIQGMRSLAASNPDIVLVDAHAIIVDPTNASGIAKTTLLYDGDHLNQIGALLVGKAAAKAISPWIPQNSNTVLANSDIPGDATAKQAILNPKCIGTTGTVAAGGTGSAATSWTVARQGTSNITFACRKEKNQAVPWVASTAFAVGARIFPLTQTGFHYVCTTAGTTDATEPTWETTLFSTTTDNTATWTTFPIASDDEDKEWQFFDINIPSGTNEVMRWQQSISLSSTDFAVGDTVFGRAEYKMMNARALDYMQLTVEFLSVTPAVISSTTDLATSTYSLGSYSLPEGVMRTPNAVIPAATVTLRYTLNVSGDSVGKLLFWVTNCEIRKV